MAMLGVLTYARARARRRARRYRVLVASTDVARQLSGPIRRLAFESFTIDGGSNDSSSDEDAVIDNLLGFHDAARCEWLFGIASSPRGAPPIAERELVALALLVSLHDSLYVGTLCVMPTERGRGLGSMLMRSASALAHARGFSLVSGNVSSTDARLLQFYQRLGAVATAPTAVASNGAQPKTVRLIARSGPLTCCDLPPPEMWPRGGSEISRTIVSHTKAIN